MTDYMIELFLLRPLESGTRNCQFFLLAHTPDIELVYTLEPVMRSVCSLFFTSQFSPFPLLPEMQTIAPGVRERCRKHDANCKVCLTQIV